MTSEIVSLVSADKFEVGGRGTAYSFHGVEGLNPRELVGHRIIMDGRLVTVTAAETNALTNVTSRSFALLVKEE